MIGDLILSWRRLRTAARYHLSTWFRRLVCVHDYVGKRTPARAFTWRQCLKCGRTRDWSSWH